MGNFYLAKIGAGEICRNPFDDLLVGMMGCGEIEWRFAKFDGKYNQVSNEDSGEIQNYR